MKNSNPLSVKNIPDLVAGVNKIVSDWNGYDSQQLAGSILLYISNRDRKVFDHAFKLGKESNGKENS